MDDNNAAPPQEQEPLPLPLPGRRAGRRNLLVTSALPYVNNVPHLGNIVGAVLSADVFARFARQRGENVLYVCGTDEYGTATEKRAAEEGVSPEELCAKYHAIHAAVYEWFDCKFDQFGRTTTEAQTEIAQDIFTKLHARGLIKEDTIEQLFCTAKCQTFQADRFVEGTCPLCQAPGARGDQCDACGKLLNAVELKDPVCKTCGSSTSLEVRATTHLFLDLPKMQGDLQVWLDRQVKEGRWTTNARTIAQSWMKEGLRPRCITRDLKWGTPVPLDGFRDKVFYVWFDAPIGYISISAALLADEGSATGERTGSGWKEWWKPAADSPSGPVELHQFMGKDNVPFHSIIFPASLIGADDGWTTLHHLNATEYLTYEGQKFSKSNNVGVFGTHCKETGVPAEVWRYYLLALRPESSDADFFWKDLQGRNNSELIANLGNFCNRAISFTAKNFDGLIPGLARVDGAQSSVIESDGDLGEAEHELQASVDAQLSKYNKCLERSKLREGLHVALEISRLGNGYLQAQAPWVLLKGGDADQARAGVVLYSALSLAQLLASVLQPYMPGFSREVFKQLGFPERDDTPAIPDRWSICGNSPVADVEGQTESVFLPPLVSGTKMGKPAILFKKLDDAQIEGWRKKYGAADEAAGEASKAFPLDLRGGIIKGFRPHPNDDKRALVILDVDVGEDSPRQIVGRLGPVVGMETSDSEREKELVGQRVVVLCNLPPANLSGEESQGMCLVAETRKTKTQPARQILLSTVSPGNVSEGAEAAAADSDWVGVNLVPSGWEAPGKDSDKITLAQFQKLEFKIAGVPVASLTASSADDNGGDNNNKGKGKGKGKASGPSAFVAVFDKEHYVSVRGEGKVFVTAEGVSGVCKIK